MSTHSVTIRKEKHPQVWPWYAICTKHGYLIMTDNFQEALDYTIRHCKVHRGYNN